MWNDFIQFQISYSRILDPNMRVIVFFELIDRQNENIENDVKLQQRIAWAFLKIIDGNKHKSNCGKKVRLQLFRIPRIYRAVESSQDPKSVFHWWRDLPRIRFTGTLYVTVKPARIVDRESTEESRSSTFPDIIYEQQQISTTTEPDDLQICNPIPLWSRLPGQKFKIPNKRLQVLVTGRLGATVLRFSSTGRLLACASKESNSQFPIYIFEFPNGRRKVVLFGHLQIVHDLCWSADLRLILSASSDCTTRLWQLSTGLCIQIVPHVTFVYCALLHPTDQQLIITGAYDSRIRIWKQRADNVKTELLGELTGHKSGVNCIQLSLNGKRLYSADGQGLVKVWQLVIDEDARTAKEPFLSSMSTIKDEQMEGRSISSMLIPENGRFIGLQTFGGRTRLLDMRTNCLRADCLTSTDPTTLKLNCRGCLSPCDSWLFCGSVDGTVHVWNTDDGGECTVYRDGSGLPVLSVHVHPLDNYVVFSQFGPDSKLYVFGHDSNVPELPKELSQMCATQVGERKDYANFFIHDLIAKHQILTKLDSIEDANLKSIQVKDSIQQTEK